ncbi:hypothetical protein ABTL72_19620, partial [Acinetobacter baumannii]
LTKTTLTNNVKRKFKSASLIPSEAVGDYTLTNCARKRCFLRKRLSDNFTFTPKNWAKNEKGCFM